ncbi:hypothetical protein [Agrobacterium tumefaciens]|uniref:hypothetical protein n=1 Tax=Agrobacterium tumefaciens TaxID=358 RepID=UPI00157202BB|nr:hypothetical protein [Agrobacterium tumefaciens]
MLDATKLEPIARLIKAKIKDRDDSEARTIREGYILICCAAAAVETGLMTREESRAALKEAPQVVALLNFGIRQIAA